MCVPVGCAAVEWPLLSITKYSYLSCENQRVIWTQAARRSLWCYCFRCTLHTQQSHSMHIFSSSSSLFLSLYRVLTCIRHSIFKSVQRFNVKRILSYRLPFTQRKNLTIFVCAHSPFLKLASVQYISNSIWIQRHRNHNKNHDVFVYFSHSHSIDFLRRITKSFANYREPTLFCPHIQHSVNDFQPIRTPKPTTKLLEYYNHESDTSFRKWRTFSNFSFVRTFFYGWKWNFFGRVIGPVD